MKSNPIITDEMLAAYLAGNATKHETALILRAIETDSVIRETLHIMSHIECESKYNCVHPSMAMAAKDEGNNLCAIRCVGYALRHFGVEITDEQLRGEAERFGDLVSGGMPFGLVCECIRRHGLNAQIITRCSVDLLCQYLSQNTVVIALVDGGELIGNQAVEQWEDVLLGFVPDHAVVIDSLSAENITIRDSSTSQRLDTYPLPVFINAWEDSNMSIIVVNKIDTL